MGMEEEQLELLFEENEDTWFIPNKDIDSIIVLCDGRYYLWENEKPLQELIPTPIIIDEDLI